MKLNIPYFPRMKIYVHEKTCSGMFTAHLFMPAKTLVNNCCLANRPWYTEDKGRPKKGRPLQIGFSNFDKQGNLLTRLISSGWKMSRSSYPPARTFKVHRDLTWVQSVFSPGGLNNMLLSQGCILHHGSHYGNGGKNAHSKDRAGDEELLMAQVQLVSQPMVTSSQGSPLTATWTPISRRVDKHVMLFSQKGPYSAIKRMVLVIHLTTWINPAGLMLSRKSQTLKSTHIVYYYLYEISEQ